MKRNAILLAILATSALSSAHAAVVTFDDAAGQAATGGYMSGDSFSDGGLTFTYSGGAFMQLWDASGFGPAPGSNGTNTLLVGASATDHVTITQTGGGLFSIASLLLGINEPTAPETTDSVLVNGVSEGITNTATNYAFSLNNVTSVTISALQAEGGYVSIDNITYQVPEPASLAVFGIGLGGMALARRRRRTSSAV